MSIHVDEERVHVLTKNIKTKNGIEHTKSDHNLILTKLKLTWSPKSNKIIEVFKFNDAAAKQRFKKATTETTQLSKLIDKEKSIHLVTKQFIKRLKGFVQECFTKVKIEDKPNTELDNLYNKRTVLRTKSDDKSLSELEEVENELSEKYSESMYRKIMGEVKGFEDSEDGGFNAGKLWKLRRKLSPKTGDPPCAMQSAEGKLLTTDEDIKEEAIKHYEKVFKAREITEGLEGLKVAREKLCEKRLIKSSQNKTAQWTVEDVTNVLKSLKTGKSKDPYELPNKLFRPNTAGDDLILAVTKLMNRIKDELVFPDPMTMCNMTNLYKNKGSKQSFDSYRGIFRTPVLRNILDKLMYEDEYEDIDEQLTDCNVGSRRRRNVRDNLFVMNAVTSASKNILKKQYIYVYMMS